MLIKWHCIHLISCCLSPITHFSTATSGARGGIIQLELGIETRYLIKWHCIHLISCCLSFITYFSTATSGVRGGIIQLGLGLETRYGISFIIRISRTVENFASVLSVSYLF